MGCSGATRTEVIHGPRSVIYATANVVPASKTTAAMLTFAIVFELGRKSCAIWELTTHAELCEVIRDYIPRSDNDLRSGKNRSREDVNAMYSTAVLLS